MYVLCPLRSSLLRKNLSFIVRRFITSSKNPAFSNDCDKSWSEHRWLYTEDCITESDHYCCIKVIVITSFIKLHVTFTYEEVFFESTIIRFIRQ